MNSKILFNIAIMLLLLSIVSWDGFSDVHAGVDSIQSDNTIQRGGFGCENWSLIKPRRGGG